MTIMIYCKFMTWATLISRMTRIKVIWIMILIVLAIVIA